MNSDAVPGLSDGERAFEPIRYRSDGSTDPDSVLNREPYRDASILLSGRNVGAGSPRSSGVTWPMDMGIQVVIAPSFGPIFCTNPFRFGMLMVPLEFEVFEELPEWTRSNPGVEMTVDLEREGIEVPGMGTVSFEIDARVRRKMLEDLEEIRFHI